MVTNHCRRTPSLFWIKHSHGNYDYWNRDPHRGGLPSSNICLKSRSNEGSKSEYWETVPCNGYFSKFNVYTGKEKEREQGLGEHVVKTLTKGLEHKHHHVFFDNFFTSVKLLEDLHEDGIYGYGTVTKGQKGLTTRAEEAVLEEEVTYYPV